MCLIQKESKFICLFTGSKQDGEVVLVVLVNTLIQAILGKKEIYYKVIRADRINESPDGPTSEMRIISE